MASFSSCWVWMVDSVPNLRVPGVSLRAIMSPLVEKVCQI